MDQNNAGTGDLRCYTVTTGVEIPYVPGPSGSIGQVIAANTYYFPVGSQNAPTASQTALVGTHLKWAAAVAGTITIETCNFPRFYGGSREGGGIDVDDFVTTDWVPYNPSTIGTFVVQVTGTGNSVTALTITAGGTNAGTAFINMPDIGCRRLRIKVVTTVGGLIRVNSRGKFGE